MEASTRAVSMEMETAFTVNQVPVRIAYLPGSEGTLLLVPTHDFEALLSLVTSRRFRFHPTAARASDAEGK